MALLTIDQLLKAFPESARKKLSGADLHEACKRLNEQLPEVSAYIDHIDLLKDELQRIAALSDNTEINGLCERDLRTKEGRRNEILDQIEECGGFSIFWVTENHLRACVAEEMQESGEIITDNKTHGFPWIGARISKQNVKADARLEKEVEP